MIDNILVFIETHSEWAISIVFVIALLESLVVIGLFIPGWVLLVGIGGLIGADILNFYSIVIAAYTGAVIGEYFSYHLGYHYHQAILDLPLVKRHQKLVKYSQDFFERHGPKGVFIGRFFGPTRSFVPFIAGICEMPKSTFLWVNCVSGLLWAPLYLIPGMLVGTAINLDKEQSYFLLLTLFVIGVGVSLVYKFNKPIFSGVYKSKNMMLLKAFLAWSILIYLVIIFARSPMWALLIDILLVVWSKL